MKKVAIVGPNIFFLNDLESKLLACCPGWKVTDKVTELQVASDILKDFPIGVLFLSLDYSSGAIRDFFTKFHNSPHSLVLMTAKNAVPREVFQYDVLDFIFDPAKESDLVRVYQKVKQKELDEESGFRFLVLNQMAANIPLHITNLAIPTIEGFVFVPVDEIIRLEANGAYTQIYTDTGEKIVSSRNIKEFEKQLPENSFFRVHNSHMVNIKKLSRYDKGRGGFLTLQDGSKVIVSTRRKAAFLSLFQ